jgi:hypothetical protein
MASKQELIKSIYSTVFYQVDINWNYMFNYTDLSYELWCSKTILRNTLDKLLPKTPYKILEDETRARNWVYIIIRR